MIENDTVRLLRECDAGTKMGLTAIDEVMDYTKDQRLRDSLNKSREEHKKIKQELQSRLAQCHDNGKEPNVMAKSMSWMKTNMKLTMDKSDSTVADLITDGCNMGIKSLNKYFNQYKAADESSKELAKKLIGAEKQLAYEVREFL
jgi:hypothetical protein